MSMAVAVESAVEQFRGAEHLRAYLKRLPDFEDFEAEHRALEVAAGLM